MHSCLFALGLRYALYAFLTHLQRYMLNTASNLAIRVLYVMLLNAHLLLETTSLHTGTEDGTVNSRLPKPPDKYLSWIKRYISQA